MATSYINIELKQSPQKYRITITDGHSPVAGKWARKCLGKAASRIAVISNKTVFSLYGEKVVEDLQDEGFAVFVWLMKDGEEHKNLKNVEAALDFLAVSEISRTDAVFALGGGVVGDLAGFVSAIYLRGVAFLQMPTTFLSMIDSSVGGKTGVNTRTGKNRVGSFHQPKGVLIRTNVLATLPPRELTAGLCEAVKHGTLSGKLLFDQTSEFISKYDVSDFPVYFTQRSFRIELSELILAQVDFKASVVRSDEREQTGRVDRRSRKVLNLGHTLAHALEAVSNYKYFKHGEAVGHGLVYAAEISKNLALLDAKVVNLLYDVVHRSGDLPPLNGFDPVEVFEAFRFDKKQVAGSLQMVLLDAIGKPRIVSGSEIPRSTHLRVLKKLLK